MQFDDFKRFSLETMKERLVAHCNKRNSGFRNTGLSMPAFLGGLVYPSYEAVGVDPGSDDFVDAIAARYNLCTDIVVGKYGSGTMMDAILCLDADLHWNACSQFPDRDFAFTSLIVGRTAMVYENLYYKSLPEHGPLDLKVILERLLHTQSNWADDTFLDLVSGLYGVEVQANVASAIEDGFDYDGTSLSTLRAILGKGRVELLRKLADLGMPEPLKVFESGKKHIAATTETGQWLDILTNIRGVARTTFPSQINDYRNSSFVVDLVDILLKHDPSHKTIESMSGLEGYAIITESLMRNRINMTPSVDTVPGRTRHRRGSL